MNRPPQIDQSATPAGGSGVKAKVFAALGAVFCAVYLLNPGAGFIELIPDNVPLIGNIDEAAVTGLLIYCLSILGVKLPGARARKDEEMKDVGPGSGR
ncbi:DUF1232 domain-containing protein [Phragmitibacter flavus]|uniref:DUF1232 domain-containing protein n=2 Tax=Phragmitibacter flavus TaxID=2576071 RepID=A0A5R8KDN0_9BACT|nr:DUF1232 domain-containing protein [Phragmitibacter flavus]